MKNLTIVSIYNQEIQDPLYHGSGAIEIYDMRKGGTSFGEGVYLAEEASIAIAYAKKRLSMPKDEKMEGMAQTMNKFGGAPTLYRICLNDNLKIADLFNINNIEVISEEIERRIVNFEAKASMK